MELNLVVFPGVKPSYTHKNMYGQLIYIPRDHTQWSLSEPYISSMKVSDIYDKEKLLEKCGAYKGKCIPCLYLPYPEPSTKILIYFHGNAEDAFLTKDLIEMMQEGLRFHAIVVEYAGYGVYKGKTTSEGVLQDAELVYQYIINITNFQPEDIIVFGRSIGSGPAAYLASKHPVNSLILMSAFISVRAVAKDLVGSLLQYIIADRFRNNEYLTKVHCPVFIIHGRSDDIIPLTQAEELKLILDKNKIDCKLHTPQDMTHNAFDFINDFVQPLIEFYHERHFSTESSDTNKGLIFLPIKAFNKPI